MRILRDPKKLNPCVLVLGMFDGVHRGHQALLMKGDELAQSMVYPLAVCTFDPHPLKVLRPDRMPPLLTTLPEKARLMAQFGVDGLCITTFDRDRADQSPEDYMAEMVEVYQPVAVVCGYNFTFGKGGKGNGEMLRAYGQEHGFETIIVPEVDIDGAPVSSTRVRENLSRGDVRTAARLMGHPFTLTGKVRSGKALGRTMGFPTANVTIPQGKALPAFGVYCCWLETEKGYHEAVVNVGRHPTLPEGSVTVEAYVPDAQLDLYGKTVRLTFLHHLRMEQRFDSVEDLKAQMAQDTENCRAYFASLE